MKIHEVYKSYNLDFFTGTVSIWILFLLQDILHTVRCLQCHSLYPLGASSTHAFNGDKISPGMGSWEGPEWVRSEWTGTVDMGSTLSRTPNLQTHKKGQSSFLCGARLTEVSNSTFRPRCGCWSCVQKTSTMAFSLGSFMVSDDFPTETLPDPSVWYSPCFPYLYVTAPPLCSAVYSKHAELLGCWGFSTRAVLWALLFCVCLWLHFPTIQPGLSLEPCKGCGFQPLSQRGQNKSQPMVEKCLEI